MLNIISHQENKNQNCNKLPLYTHSDSYDQNNDKKKFGGDIDRLETILHPFVISMLPKKIPYRAPEAELIKCSRLSNI